MSDLAAWFASAATIVAALMTASNLGTRLTGSGFAVFAAGSVAWTVVGLMSGQTSLAVTNGFLLLVNLFGVWRWLGREAKHEHGGEAAAENSRATCQVPTLFSGSQLIGAKVVGLDGARLGHVVDTMLASDTKQLSYVVIGQGGIGGAGEALRAIGAAHMLVEDHAVRCNLTAAQIAALPEIEGDAWPVVASEPPAAPAV